MKPVLMLSMVLGVLVPSAAYADMIEIKGKGFLNGTIVSQDADHVVFKDSKGGTHDVRMKDVTFLERQTEKPKAAKLADKAAHWFKKTNVEATQPAPAQKPSGSEAIAQARSIASRASAASDASQGITATDAMGQSAVAMEMIDLAGQAQANAQVAQARVQNALNASGEDSLPKKYDARKGKFGNLDAS